MSADKPERDLVVKGQEYAEAGIPEYWIVNPLDQTVTVLTLGGDRYIEHGIFHARDACFLGVVGGFLPPGERCLWPEAIQIGNRRGA